MSSLIKRTKAVIAAPPEPFLVTSRTIGRVAKLIESMPPEALILNVGAGFTDYGDRVINVDIFDSGTTKVIASALELPFSNKSVDLIIMQGVLEHVTDADETFRECFRVLKNDGLYYTEMPFLQPYHESPIDLRRCTKSGLAEFCLPLTEIETGIHIGPASTITWILREFLTGVLSGGNPKLYPRINSLVGWLVFPLKYADYWLEKKPHYYRIASSIYYLGKKVG
jgi:SAM-dependent methyltransferase